MQSTIGEISVLNADEGTAKVVHGAIRAGSVDGFTVEEECVVEWVSGGITGRHGEQDWKDSKKGLIVTTGGL